MEVVALLAHGRTFRCDPGQAEWEEDFDEAYDWMAARMGERVGPTPRGARWPVWAWSLMSGRTCPSWWFSLNMVPTAFHLRYHIRWPTHDARLLRWIELEVAPARVLESDFDLWHSILNTTYCQPRNQWDDDSVWDVDWPREELEATWPNALHIDPSCPDVQATLWEVLPEDVVAVHRWWAPRLGLIGLPTHRPARPMT